MAPTGALFLERRRATPLGTSRACVVALVLLGSPALSTASVNVWHDGLEIQFNQEVTTGIHTEPSVVSTGLGRMVLVWRGHRATSDQTNVVWIAAVDHGHRTGREIVVNSNEILGSSNQPVVKGLSSIGPVVVWTEFGQDGDELGISLQRLTPELVARAPQTVANSYTVGDQISPSIAVAVDGSFFLAWEDVGIRPGFPRADIRGRLYSPDGVPQGEDFLVAATTEGYPFGPRTAALKAGEFLTVWSATANDSTEIFARGYDAYGPRGPRFRINTTTSSEQLSPDVAACVDGRILVAWQSYGQPEDPEGGIYAQWFSPTFEKLGEEIHVNVFTAGRQSVPTVAVTPDCRGIVAWQSLGQDGSGDGVFGRLLESDGGILSDEIQINTSTAGSQGAYYYRTLSVAADSSSSFFVAWPTSPADDGQLDVIGQWFCIQDVSPSTGSVCGDATCVPDADGNSFDVGVNDALEALRTAVGLGVCRTCRCDVNESGRVTVADALILLRAAVGIPANLRCPPCTDSN